MTWRWSAAEFKRCADKGQDPGFYGAVRHFLEAGAEAFAEDELYKNWKVSKTHSDPAGGGRISAGPPADLEDLRAHRLLRLRFRHAGGKGAPGQSLDMLVEKACAFEATSYQSLFDFIRYIERLKKYNTDFGEAARAGENDDTVRIMSIHKSKGLEFRGIFSRGRKEIQPAGRQGKILIDDKLGIATDYLDLERKVKAPTLRKMS